MPAKKRPRAKKAAAQPPAERGSGRAYSVKLPPDVAERAEAIAKEEGRRMSEMFESAMRCYLKELERVRNRFDEIGEYVKTLPPTAYTEEDVPRLVKEARAEMRAERGARARKAG